jgi:hypothetical protein
MLHRHQRRTGVDLKRLLAGRDDAPACLNIEEIERFCSGEAKRLPRDHFEYLIDAWSNLPNARRRSRVRCERIDLTPALRAELRGHWLRVGLSIPAFFRSLDNPPPDLSAGNMRRWIDGRHPRRVWKDHVEFVLAAWRKLPDSTGRLRRIHFIPFAQDT